MLKGHHIDQQELVDEMIYWFCAHHFGFTPEQVDKLPYDRMVYFIELEQEFKRQQKISMEK